MFNIKNLDIYFVFIVVFAICVYFIHFVQEGFSSCGVRPTEGFSSCGCDARRRSNDDFIDTKKKIEKI